MALGYKIGENIDKQEIHDTKEESRDEKGCKEDKITCDCQQLQGRHIYLI